MVKQIKTETLAMREMFEHYYQLGRERSYRKVSQKFKISEVSIKRYASSFNWKERVEQRDLENASELEKRTNETVVNSKALYRETIKRLTDSFIKDVDAGKIKIRGILDFERVVRLDMDLMGVTDGSDAKRLVDNMSTLAGALGMNGWNSVPDLSEKGNSTEEEE